MSWKTIDFWLAYGLVAYLLIVGVGAAVAVVLNFPEQNANGIVFPQGADGRPTLVLFGPVSSIEQGLIALALLAGMTGSFLHAAQSLITFIGNSSFTSSWTAWYFLRPWIGSVLAFAVYFALRAGMVTGADGANPYGVVALGILAGWFSKTTTDKLQEVFGTLFKTDQDTQRKDKLA